MPFCLHCQTCRAMSREFFLFFSWQCFSCFTAKRGKCLRDASHAVSFRFRPFSWLCQKSFSLSRVFSPAQIFWAGRARLFFFRPALKNTLPKVFWLVKKNFSFFSSFLGSLFLRPSIRGRVTESSVPVCLDLARTRLACQEFFSIWLFGREPGKPQATASCERFPLQLKAFCQVCRGMSIKIFYFS